MIFLIPKLKTALIFQMSLNPWKITETIFRGGEEKKKLRI